MCDDVFSQLGHSQSMDTHHHSFTTQRVTVTDFAERCSATAKLIHSSKVGAANGDGTEPTAKPCDIVIEIDPSLPHEVPRTHALTTTSHATKP